MQPMCCEVIDGEEARCAEHGMISGLGGPVDRAQQASLDTEFRFLDMVAIAICAVICTVI